MGGVTKNPQRGRGGEVKNMKIPNFNFETPWEGSLHKKKTKYSKF